MNIQHERRMASTDAFIIAEATLSMLRVKTEMTVYGSELKTYHCKLIDEKNGKLFYGCGKGLGVQSKVSACYEAIEHYVTHHFYRNGDYQIHNGMPSISLFEVSHDKVYTMPIFMIDPRYAKYPLPNDHIDYKSCAWRASDSGVASGTDFTEASIHALNEIIERDAHSLFLIEAFIKQKNKSIRIIDRQTIPLHLLDIVNQIECELDEELIIIDITSDIGVPVVAVSMTKQPYPIQPVGFGASLNREYALERALLESLQPVHISNHRLWQNQYAIIDNFSQHPLLQAAAIADVRPLCSEGESIDFSSLPAYNLALTLEEQLACIMSQIHHAGFDIYHKVLAQYETGFTCVKYHVPGLEQFYLVQAGKNILPNDRGMKYLKANRL